MLDKLKVVITDYWYETLEMERKVFSEYNNLELHPYQCKDENKLVDIVKDADAVIVQFAPISRRVIQAMEHCKIIVRYAIGVDNIDLEAATEKGIFVANVPDYGVDEVSNHAIALLFALAKKIVPLTLSVKKGKWDYTVTKPLYRMQGKTLGLIGLGRIPSLVAKKMSNFGLNIISYDPYVDQTVADDLYVKLLSLDELLSASDYVSIHCPLNAGTRHMISTAQFSKMKPTAILINTARGAVIDEKALIEALESKRIAAAGLDVLESEPVDPNNPLLFMENVIVTPHNAWYSEEATMTLQRMVAEEVARVLSGNLPRNLVNKGVLSASEKEK